MPSLVCQGLKAGEPPGEDGDGDGDEAHHGLHTALAADHHDPGLVT